MTWLADRAGTLIIALGALMLIANLLAVLVFPKVGGRLISGDAMGHFVQLRSVVYDHDLDFSNEYTRLYLDQHPNAGNPNWRELLPTPTGRVRMYMSVGPAILWAPLYLLVSGVLLAASALGLAPMPNGYDRALQVVPDITGVIAATAAAWLSWRLAARVTDRASAGIGAVAVWLGSNAIYYSMVAPSYSHATSMFAVALLLTHWFATRDRWTLGHAALSGVLAGIATLMRWQDIVWFAVPLIESLRAPGRAIDRLGRLAVAGAGWLVVFSPQMAIWTVLYGSPITVPQGSDFMEWTSPNLVSVLIDANHGLFSWSPILVLAAFGLAKLIWRDRRLALPLGIVILGSWYVNAAVADWWAGEAFGARRFLSLFPLFVLGLAVWVQPALEAGRRWRGVVVTALVAANVLFLFQYQVFMRGWRDLAPYPSESWVDLWLMRFAVPFRVIARWMKGLGT